MQNKTKQIKTKQNKTNNQLNNYMSNPLQFYDSFIWPNLDLLQFLKLNGGPISASPSETTFWGSLVAFGRRLPRCLDMTHKKTMENLTQLMDFPEINPILGALTSGPMTKIQNQMNQHEGCEMVKWDPWIWKFHWDSKWFMTTVRMVFIYIYIKIFRKIRPQTWVGFHLTPTTLDEQFTHYIQLHYKSSDRKKTIHKQFSL